MQYRLLPKDENIKLSIIGFGAAQLKDNKESDALLEEGLEAGINFMDSLPSEGGGYEALRRVIGPVRKDVHIQLHLGCTYANGKYGWTRNIDEIKKDWERQLNVFNTNYADFGFIHCIDEVSDFEEMFENGLWDFAQELKKNDGITHLGCSTHNVEIAKRFLEIDDIDFMMFSINPMYDYTNESSYGKGSTLSTAGLSRAYCTH